MRDPENLVPIPKMCNFCLFCWGVASILHGICAWRSEEGYLGNSFYWI